MIDDPQALIADLDMVEKLTGTYDSDTSEYYEAAMRLFAFSRAVLEAALTGAPAECSRFINGPHEPHDTHEGGKCSGRTPTPASTDARETLRRAIGGVLFNVANFPERVHSRLLGTDMSPLNAKLTDAILAAGFTLPVTRDDAKAEALEEYADELAERGGPINEVWASSVRARAATYRATSQKGDGQ